MFLVLFLLFTAMPIAEIYLLIKSSDIIGTWNTVALVLLSGFLGAWFVRTQAFDLIRKLNMSITHGQVPGDELIAAMCVFVGGVLMIAPGFITDIMGLLLVLPPSRFLLSKLLKLYFAKLVRKGFAKVHVFSNKRFTQAEFDGLQYNSGDKRPMKDVTNSSSEIFLNSKNSSSPNTSQKI